MLMKTARLWLSALPHRVPLYDEHAAPIVRVYLNTQFASSGKNCHLHENKIPVTSLSCPLHAALYPKFLFGWHLLFSADKLTEEISGCFMLRTIWPQLLHHSSASKIKLLNLYRIKRRLSWKFSYHNIQITNKMPFIFMMCFIYNVLTNMLWSLLRPLQGEIITIIHRYNVVNCVVTP